VHIGENLTITSAHEADAPIVEPDLDESSPSPVLITTDQVALGTAAVLARPATTSRSSHGISAALGALRRMVMTNPIHADGAHGHYPRRYVYLECACMGREMDRL
jgi:hypothetical protein